MHRGTYWSVEDCCWVDCPEPAASAEASVPAQREDEPAVESVEA